MVSNHSDKAYGSCHGPVMLELHCRLESMLRGEAMISAMNSRHMPVQ